MRNVNAGCQGGVQDGLTLLGLDLSAIYKQSDFAHNQ
jgi:hypothetical protein